MRYLPILIALLACTPGRCTAQQKMATDTYIPNIPYVPEGGHKQQLDLYLPDNGDFPTLLFVHGGSLTGGDRRDEPFGAICERFREEGVACAALSYRLAPEHTWPTQPNDVAAAFAWIKEHIGDYGGDAGRVYLFGHSSGCLLISIIATDPSYLEAQGYAQKDIAGLTPMGCRLNEILKVANTSPEDYESYHIPPEYVDRFHERSAVYLSVEQKNNAVPARHVDASLPPFLLLIAEAERFFPPVLRDGAEFVGRARSAGAQDADLMILEDRTHMSSIRMMADPEDPAFLAVLQFIGSHR